MNANEPGNTRLRSAFGQLDAQSLLVHGLQKPRTQDFADFKCTPENTPRGGVILVDFVLNTFAFIGVYLRLNFLPAALTRYFPIGITCRLGNPRRCGQQATGFFDSTGRRGSLGLRVRQRDMGGAQTLLRCPINWPRLSNFRCPVSFQKSRTLRNSNEAIARSLRIEHDQRFMVSVGGVCFAVF